jgi:hypothetical protein
LAQRGRGLGPLAGCHGNGSRIHGITHAPNPVERIGMDRVSDEACRRCAYAPRVRPGTRGVLLRQPTKIARLRRQTRCASEEHGPARSRFRGEQADNPPAIARQGPESGPPSVPGASAGSGAVKIWLTAAWLASIPVGPRRRVADGAAPATVPLGIDGWYATPARP